MFETYDYSKMTIEELFNLYYFSRANMERAVKSHCNENIISSYAIDIGNIINEVKNRINLCNII